MAALTARSRGPRVQSSRPGPSLAALTRKRGITDILVYLVSNSCMTYCIGSIRRGSRCLRYC
jgi:hypothetical protein